ncbi:MAG: hypothetical protein LBU64_09740, partial [Planctomycetota bacterium]|nr:hypothetical protein [Planctomycetota bacterium]
MKNALGGVAGGFDEEEETMKHMRLAAFVAAIAMVGGTVLSGDLDIQALQAKLAAQEARLNDLQAKIGGGKADAPASVLSARKNATLRIGGT